MAAKNPTGIPPRYRLIRLLGQGGMGSVYLAHDQELDQSVALKVIRLGLEPTVLARFRREAEVLQSLSHPHLVALLDHDLDGPTPYIALEYFSGKDLETEVPENPLEAMLGVAEGLAELHARGILHRDIKPANILLSKEGRVALADLGLAKNEQSETLTKTGLMIGTPAYLAPEIFLGSSMSRASDWYAWGMTLYHLVESRLKIDTDRVHAIMAAAPVPPVRLTQVDRNSPLAALLYACTASDPTARPSGLGEIRRLLAGTNDRGSEFETATVSETAALRPPPASKRSTLAPDKSGRLPVPPPPTPTSVARAPLPALGGLLVLGLMLGASGLVNSSTRPERIPTNLAPTSERGPNATDTLGEATPSALGPDFFRLRRAVREGALLQPDFLAAYKDEGVGAYRRLSGVEATLEQMQQLSLSGSDRQIAKTFDASFHEQGLLPLLAPFLEDPLLPAVKSHLEPLLLFANPKANEGYRRQFYKCLRGPNKAVHRRAATAALRLIAARTRFYGSLTSSSSSTDESPFSHGSTRFLIQSLQTQTEGRRLLTKLGKPFCAALRTFLVHALRSCQADQSQFRTRLWVKVADGCAYALIGPLSSTDPVLLFGGRPDDLSGRWLCLWVERLLAMFRHRRGDKEWEGYQDLAEAWATATHDSIRAKWFLLANSGANQTEQALTWGGQRATGAARKKVLQALRKQAIASHRAARKAAQP